MKGKFITFEGCEGAGKSAQIRLLAKYLDERNIPYITTREPGGTPAAEKIRQIILDTGCKGMAYECEVLLYAASRCDHVKNVILPALNEGKMVLCDRYIDSSLAYQAYARGLGDRAVEMANYYPIENCMPDVTLFLDLRPEEAFKRKGGADGNDRIEAEGLSFHNKVYEGYCLIASRFPARVERVCCSGAKDETHSNIIAALKRRGILP